MKYTAKTHVALNVIKNGKSMHISFTPITGGGSVFYTDDEEVAKALENHYKFNHLFKRAKEQPKILQEEKVAPVAQEQEVNKEKTMTFACYEDAKDYLVDTFGISRTKLRTQTAIQAAAKANNITLQIDE